MDLVVDPLHCGAVTIASSPAVTKDQILDIHIIIWFPKNNNIDF
jgi:hypothetical protein